MTTFGRSIDGDTITPALVMPWDAEDEAQTVVHPILGAQYPDVSLRPAVASTGTMQLFFLSFEAVEAARLFFRPAATFTTTSTLGWMPARFVPQGRIRRWQQPQNLKRWILDVPYQEIAP